MSRRKRVRDKRTPSAGVWSLLRLSGAALSACVALAALAGFGVRAAGIEDANQSASVSLRFAYGDFDGDHKTDLAFVQTGSSDDRETNYLIQFRFSTELPEKFDLRGPTGGLEIIARDVNGDERLDLVVRSALGSRLVAVLLNDGRGSFSFAEPGDFPELQESSTGRFDRLDGILLGEAAVLQSRGNSDSEVSESSRTSGETAVDEIFSSEIQQFRRSVIVGKLGRAPPSNIGSFF